MSKKAQLLREIKSLGGDQTDFDLIKDALSGSEAEEEDEVTAPTQRHEPIVIDEKELEADLMQFYNMLGIKGMAPIEDSEDEIEVETVTISESEPLTKLERKKLKRAEARKILMEAEETQAPSALDLTMISEGFLDEEEQEDPEFDGLLGRAEESNVRDMVGQILKGIKPSDGDEDLIIEPNNGFWYDNNFPSIPTIEYQPAQKIKLVYDRAEALWRTDASKYEKKRAVMSKANKDFISTILKSGTVTDKVSALTLLIQESPIHSFAFLRDQLIQGMAKKKARREAMLAVDSIKDLMLNNLLPDRKLRLFVDQPCLGKDVSAAHLVVWFFEDALKKSYFEFIQILEELSKDALSHVKNKMISCIFELLSAKPEEEGNLLTLLVNKMGDLDKKIASKATHLLSKLLVQHPAMKQIVISEVERLLLRPNIGDRARYYAITFLNQIVLTKAKADVDAANKLIGLYFTIFTALVKSMKSETGPAAPIKKDRKRDGYPKKNMKKADVAPPLMQVDSLNSKMMAALLTGVNRAFPFAKLESEVFESHIDTLFVISHLATFNTSIQALTLIFQVQSARELLSDRFYRSLYDSLFDRRLFEASKQAMYLNLLYRSLKSDPSMERIRAFVKRLTQSGSLAQVPLLCGSLFLLSELCHQRPGLWSMVTEPEEHDEEIIQSELVPDMLLDISNTKYDGRKRDPLYANASQSCLWDLVPFANHFHPTVSLYARSILSGNPLLVPEGATNYDPLLNHTLARFLDRFVYKAPKKVKSIHHGTSLMQPRGQTNMLLAGGRKKKNAIFDDEDEGKLTALDDAPVNLSSWKSESQVPVDELFFFKFFKDSKKRSAASDKQEELSDVESNAEEIGEEEIWNAMKHSSGFDKTLIEDEDDEILNDEDGDSLTQDDEDNRSEDDGLEFDQESIDMEDLVDDQESAMLEVEEGPSGDEDEFIEQDQAFATLFEDELSEPDEQAESTSKPKKKPRQLEKFSKIATELGYEGDFFDSKSGDFASAEDFETLIQAGGEEDEEEDIKVPSRKRKSITGKDGYSKKRK